ncbi:MAG: DUF2461 domain-containing protein [Cyclobacteriaceae bacterium]|nr:DUF2461 domain-containing protein [Cyclobacteriaceae bacterium]MCH8516933.1 DUF2461 domain-containing protein [Cyclobacteriaceae bacterium]
MANKIQNDRKEIFSFLERLNRNNRKEWMDEHRDEYHATKEIFINLMEDVLRGMKEVEPSIIQMKAKEGVNRINHNKVFRPNLPTYKDHWGASYHRGKQYADFYMHVGINECFFAGGIYSPDTDQLHKIRQEIDYCGEEFLDIINESRFEEYYGDLLRESELKTSPKGYSKDHPMIKYLNLKSFAVVHPLKKEDILTDSFAENAIEAYRIIKPFHDFLDRAVDG